MRIAIDTRLNSYRVGGIPEYTNQLLMGLADLTANDVVIKIEHRKPALGSYVYGTERRRVWTPPHNRWEQTLLPWELRHLRADVIHFPDFIPLFKLRAPTVITVHDLAFVRFPEILDAAARRYYGQIGRAVQRADAIIAVSQNTRRDLAEFLNVDPARVDVVPEAAAAHFKPLDLPQHAERTINGHTLRRDTFALFVGTLEPRKNLPTLLRALRSVLDRHAQRRHTDADPPSLVIAGARGWLDSDIFALVRDLRLGNAVHWLGPVDTRILVWLYNACRLYLHPELYSGFGLPILEAMQCGAPVVAANVASLPEVAGNAGLLLPPEDVAAWADAWSALWHSSTRRDQLRRAGVQRAAQFSWANTARQTLAVYRRIAQPAAR